MRTYKQIVGGTINTPKSTKQREPTSDDPLVVDVNGELLAVTLGTGLTQSEKTAAPRINYSVNRRNGPL